MKSKIIIGLFSVAFMFPAIFIRAGDTPTAGREPAFPEACTSQQKAISDLIAAMKEARKIIKEKQCKDAAQEEKVFKDKQKYDKSKEQNPEEQLKALREKESEIVENLKKKNCDETSSCESASGEKESPQREKTDSDSKKPDSSALAKQQKEISGKLEEISSISDLPESVKRAVAEARKSSVQTELALQTKEELKSEDCEVPGQAAKKTLSDLDSAIRKLIEANEQKLKNAVANARRDLQNAGDSLKENKNREAAENAQKALDSLKKEQCNQMNSGSSTLAEQLNEPLKKADEEKLDEDLKKLGQGNVSGKQTDQASKKIEGFDKTLADLGRAGQTPYQKLLEDAKKLKESRDELEFSRKHPDSVKPENLKDAIADAKLAMKDTSSSIKELTEKTKAGKDEGEQTKEKTGSKECAGEKGEYAGEAGANDISQEASVSGKTHGKSDELGKNTGSSAGSTAKITPMERSGKNQGSGSGKNGDYSEESPYSVLIPVIVADIDKLLISAERILEKYKTGTIARTFNPDEVPMEYRDDVPEYFKKLSEMKNRD